MSYFNYLIALALIPGVFILFQVYQCDRIEREPISLILKLVFLGVISTIPAMGLELLIDKLVVAPVSDSRLLYALANAFLSAALVEEGLKLLFLRGGTWRDPNFDYHFDAIVYAVSVSLGFAMLENILYVIQNGVTTALVRAFSSVPLHAFCGVFMGFHYGLAKQADIDQNEGLRKKELTAAFLIPFLIHGTADALLMYNSTASYIVFLVFLAGLYFVAIRRIRYCSANDVSFVKKTQYVPWWQTGAASGAYQDTAYQNSADQNSPYQSARSAGYPDFRATQNRTRVDVFSIVGLILGVASYLTLTVLIFPDILAIIFSSIGLSRGKNGYATAGLILGITSLLIGCGVLYFIR